MRGGSTDNHGIDNYEFRGENKVYKIFRNGVTGDRDQFELIGTTGHHLHGPKCEL
jgi:hypothetical protein